MHAAELPKAALESAADEVAEVGTDKTDCAPSAPVEAVNALIDNAQCDSGSGGAG